MEVAEYARGVYERKLVRHFRNHDAPWRYLLTNCCFPPVASCDGSVWAFMLYLSFFVLGVQVQYEDMMGSFDKVDLTRDCQ